MPPPNYHDVRGAGGHGLACSPESRAWSPARPRFQCVMPPARAHCRALTQAWQGRGGPQNAPPPSFPRRREPIPDSVRHYDTRSSPSRRPAQSGGESRGPGRPGSFALFGTAVIATCSARSIESAHRPAPHRPQIPHLRHSREGGNPSPTPGATMTPEAVRHAGRPNQVRNLGVPVVLGLSPCSERRLSLRAAPAQSNRRVDLRRGAL